ncbi:hypothetical protein B0H14DRAFT_3429914 [Mycena olivaceomarginata]|nr:hypothetical protein B0H14DRAFT_3460845 [Mycena olivaceomarginata]KAJ7888938.1 hypothetical protein B0H14DRAFT_3429914 [Mycena olivaceomarginata]
MDPQPSVYAEYPFWTNRRCDAVLRPTSNGHSSLVRTSIRPPNIGTGCAIVPSSVPIADWLFPFALAAQIGH